MNGALRRPVPGQLSLLELLDDPIRLEGDAVVGPDGDVGLEDWERAVLRFAAEHHLTGRYDEQVEQRLGCSATRYLQALSGMLDRPDVLDAAPELVGRLRALRDRRQRLRALSRGGS